MSVSSNQAAVREVAAEAFNNGNFDVLRRPFEPGYVEHQFGLRPSVQGMQEDIHSLRMWFPDLSLTIEDMLGADDKVWVRSAARGTNRGGFMGPPNGKSFEIAVFDVLRFDKGKLVEHRGAPDRLALMAQMGLLPKR